jgi:hypothetical protein
LADVDEEEAAEGHIDDDVRLSAMISRTTAKILTLIVTMTMVTRMMMMRRWMRQIIEKIRVMKTAAGMVEPTAMAVMAVVTMMPRLLK